MKLIWSVQGCARVQGRRGRARGSRAVLALIVLCSAGCTCSGKPAATGEARAEKSETASASDDASSQHAPLVTRSAARSPELVDLDPKRVPALEDFAAEAEAQISKTSDLARELDELDKEITAAEAAAMTRAGSTRSASSRQ